MRMSFARLNVTALTLAVNICFRADTCSMRNFSFVGILLVVAIVGWMSKSMFAPAVSHDPSNRATVEYWVAHTSDRATMLDWCQHNPQQQDSADCQLATAAQMRADTSGGSSQPAQSTQSTQGVTQTTGQASDELQAQQDSAALGQ